MLSLDAVGRARRALEEAEDLVVEVEALQLDRDERGHVGDDRRVDLAVRIEVGVAVGRAGAVAVAIDALALVLAFIGRPRVARRNEARLAAEPSA